MKHPIETVPKRSETAGYEWRYRDGHRMPDTESLQQRLILHCQNLDYLKSKPRAPAKRWDAGMYSLKGNVRKTNEDCGVCFVIGGYQVLVAADGCGGLPHGARAAYLATLTAVACLVHECHRSRMRNPEQAAFRAIARASRRLAEEARRMNLKGEGLRTTLIVVIGSKTEFSFAYIGDGGGWVQRASGVLESFLVPQRIERNVLSASLGPDIQGEPVAGHMERVPGDLLIVGTDGVFDSVDKGFGKDVLQCAFCSQGDL